MGMPRRVTGKRLEKVVSTTLSVDDYRILEKYARIWYGENKIQQPTISHLLRYLIQVWARRFGEGNPIQTRKVNPSIDVPPPSKPQPTSRRL